MNRQRLIVYSLLASPLVIFAIFFATLDPIARGTFFREFKVKVAAQFGFGEEEDAFPEGEPLAAGENAGGQGGAGDRGGRDPSQFFASQDGDGDGKLSGDEISDQMKENLDQIDADQDGSVTLEEFEQFRANRNPGGGRRGVDPAERFASQDTDGDGKLAGEELSDRMKENLSQFDTNSDGEVTLEEYEKRFEEMRTAGRGGRRGGGGGFGGDPRAGRPERPARPQ